MSATTVEHMPLQYSDANGYVTTDPDDATEATVFTADAEVIVHMVMTRQGGWRVDASDHWIFTKTEERARFRSPQKLLEALAAGRHLQLNEITYA